MPVPFMIGCGMIAIFLKSQMQSDCTALICASRAGHTECVRLLVEAEADKELRDHVRLFSHDVEFVHLNIIELLLVSDSCKFVSFCLCICTIARFTISFCFSLCFLHESPLMIDRRYVHAR